MSKVKLKDGTVKFQGRVRMPNGQYITQVFDKKRDKKTWESEVKRKIRLNDLGFLKLNTKMLFKEACEEWFYRKVEGAKRPKTVVAYRGSLNNYSIPLLGSETIGRLSERHGDIFVKLLREKGLAPKTINRHITVAKNVLDFCVSEGWLSRSPFDRIKRVKEVDKDFNYLNAGEIQALMEAHSSSPHLYSLLMIAINTGMREAAICGLMWDCVNFDTRQIQVKRMKTGEGIEETTKTSKRRFVPINNQLLKFLRELKDSSLHSELVTVAPNGKPWDESHISSRVLSKALAKAGVRKVTFHDLRHTFASHFMMNGGNIYDLQKILGHTKVDMTQRYAHLSPEHLVQAANIVQFSGQKTKSEPILNQRTLEVLK